MFKWLNRLKTPPGNTRADDHQSSVEDSQSIAVDLVIALFKNPKVDWEHMGVVDRFLPNSGQTGPQTTMWCEEHNILISHFWGTPGHYAARPVVKINGEELKLSHRSTAKLNAVFTDFGCQRADKEEREVLQRQLRALNVASSTVLSRIADD